MKVDQSINQSINHLRCLSYKILSYVLCVTIKQQKGQVIVRVWFEQYTSKARRIEQFQVQCAMKDNFFCPRNSQCSRYNYEILIKILNSFLNRSNVTIMDCCYNRYSMKAINDISWRHVTQSSFKKCLSDGDNRCVILKLRFMIWIINQTVAYDIHWLA